MFERECNTPGIYTITAEVYHRDPCPAPSASSSLLRKILSGSPRHAWLAHPKLGGAVEEPSAVFDLGTVAHAMLLEGEDVIAEIDAPDWRTNAARDARDAARAAGRIPLLPHQADEVRMMVEAAREQLRAYPGNLLAEPEPERTLLWQQGPFWCRARPDRIQGETVIDYKTTSRSARPGLVDRLVWSMGYDVQIAWYLEGLSALLGRPVDEHRLIVQEVRPPFALSVLTLGREALGSARGRMRAAWQVWTECLGRGTTAGDWPLYAPEVVEIGAPAWLAQDLSIEGLEVEGEE